jgi:hypothetical protein
VQNSTAVDVTGYLLPEACEILQQAGYQVAVVATGNPRPYHARVLRQRQLNKNLIELTQSCEFYQDPSSDEESVPGSGTLV